MNRFALACCRGAAGLLIAGFVVGLAAVAAASAAAADTVSPRIPESSIALEPGRFRHRIAPAASPITIDGVIDEEAWDRALELDLAYETRPAENKPAPVGTRCFVTHDEGNLYVAFRADDPDPQAIRARFSDRDRAWADDMVGVVLDTFNNERQAYEFYVTPIGIQIDLRTDEVTGSEDESWDAIWHSAGRITEQGFEVEMAIPFSSLRFPRTGGEQTWGFEALRFYPRDDRHRLGLAPVRRDRSCFVCQVSKISGFEGITPGRNLEINPTVTASRTDALPEGSTGSLAEGDVDSDAGLTVSWGVTPNLTLSGTVNPDFSQVEADVAQLDINNQFALFFPERRPFFLEGADFFDTPLDAVFTRNVADPSWGAKLVGKEGRNSLGLFVAEDEVTNLLFPGSQSSSASARSFSSTDAVLRYRRDVGDGSSVGVLYTGREGSAYTNQVGGFDLFYRATDSDTFTFQWLGSDTEYPTELATEFDQPRDRFSDSAMRFGYNHSSRDWRIYARYDDLGDGFRADMGFMPRVGFTFLLGGVERTWWGEEDDRWNRINLGADWDLTENQSGQLLERELEAWWQIAGPYQSFAMLRGGSRTRFFNGVRFDESFGMVYTEASPTGDLYLELFAYYGDGVDFANTRPGKTLSLEPGFRVNFGEHLRIDVDHTLNRLDVEGGQLFEANLTQLRAIYQFDTRTFVRAVLQYTDIERDPSLYLDTVDARTERLFSQLLLSYKVNPRTVFFAGYSDGRRGEDGVDLALQDRTFFVKIGYAWVL